MHLDRSRPVRALAAVALLAATAGASFHSGGVGACGGCHSMHDARTGGSGLLLADNPTDLCLSCHGTDNGNSWGMDPLIPGPIYGGGQFVFLLEDNLNDGTGGGDPANYVPGRRAGHSVISQRKGTTADPDFTTSPGGSYPSSNLHCTSCHDPHGRGGHFRLLYGSDYPDAVVNGQRFTYTRPAPDAVGIPLDGSPEADGNHTAYRGGMMEWCANCHGDDYHERSGTAFGHPGNERLGGGEVRNYNEYRGTGFYDGTGADAYVAMVPIEFPAATTDFRGPAPSGSTVTCVTCHRAHASSGPHSGRWDFEITDWSVEGVASGSWPIPNPYESTAGPMQRQLCEKCHGPTLPGSAPTPGPAGLEPKQ